MKVTKLPPTVTTVQLQLTTNDFAPLKCSSCKRINCDLRVSVEKSK